MLGRLLSRWQTQREHAAVQRRAIPDDLWKRTLVRYPFLRRRSPEDATALRRLTSLFLDRKEFSAAGGLRLTDAMAVAIAAQAVLPVLKLGLARYDSFLGIVVHPEEVLVQREMTDDDGIVHAYEEALVGEVVPRGPMMLSWRDVRAAGQQSAKAYNVVIHEFAHVLDMANGAMDGVPQLPADLPVAEWLRTLESAHQSFVAIVEDNTPTALDAYGSNNGPAEFFAVASEAFFVKPEAMKKEHPAMYGMLCRFYLQDPAAEARMPV